MGKKHNKMIRKMVRSEDSRPRRGNDNVDVIEPPYNSDIADYPKDTTYSYVNTYHNKDSKWDITDDCIAKDCSFKHAGTKQIIVDSQVWDKIMNLTRAIDTEWMGYLTCEVTDTTYKVIDIHVPKQEVTGASANDIENASVTYDGVVHSHVNMAAFFSGTDSSFINVNHNFSIVVNKRGEYKAIQRIKLPCEMSIISECDVMIGFNSPVITDFVREAKEKLAEVTYSHTDEYEADYKSGYPAKGATQGTIWKDYNKKNEGVIQRKGLTNRSDAGYDYGC